jgi:hypothetical protein
MRGLRQPRSALGHFGVLVGVSDLHEDVDAAFTFMLSLSAQFLLARNPGFTALLNELAARAPFKSFRTRLVNELRGHGFTRERGVAMVVVPLS